MHLYAQWVPCSHALISPSCGLYQVYLGLSSSKKISGERPLGDICVSFFFYLSHLFTFVWLLDTTQKTSGLSPRLLCIEKLVLTCWGIIWCAGHWSWVGWLSVIETSYWLHYLVIETPYQLGYLSGLCSIHLCLGASCHLLWGKWSGFLSFSSKFQSTPEVRGLSLAFIS